jgi:predicted DCC family thiol-disulfide oxidoreductase YuxK
VTAGEGLTRLFYDGGCGLCHAAVAFVARRDEKSRVRFAPLGGPTFEARVPTVARAALPDSLLVLPPEGPPLVRSDAVLHLLRRLGGRWAVLGFIGALIPRPLRDVLYDAVARRRFRWFSAPEGTCPVLPTKLRDRFEP